MAKYKVLIVCLLSLFVIAGCSGKPSESKIMELVTQQVSKRFQDKFVAIKNFQKINGIEENEITYKVKISYDLLLKSDGVNFSNPYKTLKVTADEVLIKTDNGWMLK